MRLVHEPHGRALGSGRPPLLVSVCMAFVLSTFILAALPATRAAAAAPSAWAKLDLASTPSGTAAGAFAYDPATSSAVLFTTSGQTWTFDGTWTHVSPAHSPSSRFGAGMAYSPTTGRVVLFGGATGSCCPQTVFADTWTWDGTDWTHQSPAHSPPGRWYPAMATDTVHSAVVLFGGADSGLQEHNDTWAWNGTDWSNPIPDNSPGSPAKRNNASMTFDPAGNRLVLFGGLGDGGEVQDTWGWDGSAWSSLSPAHHPGPRQGATFSYDPLAQRGVLFGGYCCGISQSKNLDETWIWTGSDWTDATPADVSARPPAIEDPLSAYVPASRAVVMLDGTTDWAYRLAYPTFNWRNSYAVGPYYGRAGAAAAYDPRIGKVVMFGGDYISGGIHSYLDETKLWNGTSWEQGCYSPICGPHARTDASMAFDRATGQLVLFGGSYKTSSGSAVTVLNDTWTYDPVAQSWNQVATGANTPPARLVPSVAYDASSGKVLLFGGLTGAGTVLADTWSFNGTGWTQITTTPAQTPPARYQAAMTYDPSLNAVLLSAGAGLNDTWMWTGIGWSLLSPAHAPDPGAARMDYDAATGSVILLKDGSTTVWSWSGGDWHSSSPAYSPGTKDKPAVAFDRATGDMFFFGGVAGSTYPTTTYLGAPENETTPPR